MGAATMRRHGWSLAALALVALGAAPGVRSAAAAGLEQLDCSLKFVPDDVAFYGASFRLGEQWSAVVQSRAWARLQSLPAIKMAWGMFDLQSAIPGSWANQIQVFLHDPQVREVIDVLKELASDEVFLFGDKGCIKLVELAQELNAVNRFGSLARQLSGDDDPSAKAGMLLSVLHEELDDLAVPGSVTGFRLRNPDRVRQQLGRLETVLRQVVEAVPELKGRLAHTKVGKHDYLTLTLDGKLVPWPLVTEQLQQFEEEEGQVKEIVARLEKLSLVVAVGIRENYLLISVGPDTRLLAGLGQDSLLVHRAELKPLAPLASQRVLSVEYVSAAFREVALSTSRDIDEFVDWLTEDLVPELPLEDQQQERLEKDIAALGKDLRQCVPVPGALASISFGKGPIIETYAYDWTKYPGLVAPGPLGLLSHVGGNPVLGMAGRCAFRVEDYDLLVKWLRVGYGYFRDFAVEQMDEAEQVKFKKFMAKARPHLRAIDAAIRSELIPALADGQWGFALDGKLKSKRFLEAAPATETAMPMAEPALLLGLASADQLKRGVRQCRTAINGLLQALHDVDPENVPELSIPEPEKTGLRGGTLYSYALPADWGVDAQVLPNAALGDKVLCLSFSRDHSQRLLTPTPLASPGVLSDARQPRVLGLVFDWAGLVDAAAPWARLAAGLIAQDPSIVGGDAPARNDALSIASQVETVMGLLKVVRTYTSEARVENGVLVGHGRLELRDIDP